MRRGIAATVLLIPLPVLGSSAPEGIDLAGLVISIPVGEIPEIEIEPTPAHHSVGLPLPGAIVVVTMCDQVFKATSDFSGTFDLHLPHVPDGKPCESILFDHPEHYGAKHAGFKLKADDIDPATGTAHFLVKLPYLSRVACPRRPPETR